MLVWEGKFVFQTLVGQFRQKRQHQFVKVEPWDEVTEMFVICELVQLVRVAFTINMFDVIIILVFQLNNGCFRC